MTSLKLDIRNMDKVVAALKKLDGRMPRTIQTIAKGVGQEVKNELQVEPRGPSYPIRWDSEKQKRWFFAQVTAGNIEVPYRRTHNLQRAWNVKARGRTNAVVGNPKPQAPYVQSQKRQSSIHRDRWVTDEQAVDEVERSGAIERIARRVVSRALKLAGLE